MNKKYKLPYNILCNLCDFMTEVVKVPMHSKYRIQIWSNLMRARHSVWLKYFN